MGKLDARADTTSKSSEDGTVLSEASIPAHTDDDVRRSNSPIALRGIDAISGTSLASSISGLDALGRSPSIEQDVAGSSLTGVAKPAGDVAAVAPGSVPSSTGASWKTSGGVVRKKRTAKRVGYAREESASAVALEPVVTTSPPVSAPKHLAADISAESSGSSKWENSRRPSSSSASAKDGGGDAVGALASGAGVSHSDLGPSEVFPGTNTISTGRDAAGGGAGKEGTSSMYDSVVAEAAAMAALAASMAPGNSGGASRPSLEHVKRIGSGDLRQASGRMIFYAIMRQCAPSNRGLRRVREVVVNRVLPSVPVFR